MLTSPKTSEVFQKRGWFGARRAERRAFGVSRRNLLPAARVLCESPLKHPRSKMSACKCAYFWPSRCRRAYKALWAAIAMAMIMVKASAGNAMDQGDWLIGVNPSYSYIVLQDRSEPEGGGAGVYVQYWLTDWSALRLTGLWTGHNIDPRKNDQGKEIPGGLYQVINFSGGFHFPFDILKLSPAVEFGAGILHHRFNGESTNNFGIQIGVTIDYSLLDWLVLGVGFHYHALISNPSEYPVYFDAGPRLAIRWR